MAKNKQTAIVEFLGSGTSIGVPVPGCDCEVCRSSDPRDSRLRASILISKGAKNLIVDTGPDFRSQCLRAKVRRLHGVILTHEHADHINGLDDVRAYSRFQDRTLPVWADPKTAAVLQERFPYIWNPSQRGGGVPNIDVRIINGPFSAIGIEFTPVPILHGKLEITGLRFGNTAYLTDLRTLPAESVPLLKNLDNLIVSCVTLRRHETHATVSMIKQLHKKLKPMRTYLTHLSRHASHKDLSAIFDTAFYPA
ncbi:MAG: MBL fold metallo-hydrolase, partial [Planctomycetes bacterium]|nr:MBL fold metallo-hydrolase [Planctomycetota bacterium]